MNSIDFKIIHDDLLNWYQKNSRSLPWRETSNPYLIWISEVMLQQTQVETVIPYFNKWKKKYPDVSSVAAASEDQILKTWEGLGYYSRARNIKKSAEIIVNDHGGLIPRTYDELLALPGIGEYIASAISSIAFSQSIPALEANGVRVISRILDFHEEVNKSKNKAILRNILGNIVDQGDAGDANQAIMDLGSEICLNMAPKCTECPINDNCHAYEKGTQEIVPVKKAKKSTPHHIVVAGVILNHKTVLITKRPSDKLLGGMWEYPGGKVETGESHEQALQRELMEELGIQANVLSPINRYDHAYTHFSVSVYAYFAEKISDNIQAIEVSDYRWVTLEELDDYPMGKVDRLISKDLQKMYHK